MQTATEVARPCPRQLRAALRGRRFVQPETLLQLWSAGQISTARGYVRARESAETLYGLYAEINRQPANAFEIEASAQRWLVPWNRFRDAADAEGRDYGQFLRANVEARRGKKLFVNALCGETAQAIYQDWVRREAKKAGTGADANALLRGKGAKQARPSAIVFDEWRAGRAHVARSAALPLHAGLKAPEIVFLERAALPGGFLLLEATAELLGLLRGGALEAACAEKLRRAEALMTLPGEAARVRRLVAAEKAGAP